jgi:hypothetical protein
MEILCPANPGPRAPLVFILPVEAHNESRFGDPAALLKESGAAERWGAFFAFPQFDRTPWYADHPDGSVRQESEMLGRVTAEAEARLGFAVPPSRRLLAGFSKSGWGALSLLMRNPTRFGCAAAWDAPFETTQLGRWGTEAIFASAAHLRQHSIAALSRTHAGPFQAACRIVIHGYQNFRTDTEYAHRLFASRGILHRFDNRRASPHAWDLDWLDPLIEELMGIYHEERFIP